MFGLSLLLQSALTCVLLLLGVLSAQLCVLALLRLAHGPRGVRSPLLSEDTLPRVLVQLPVRDEGPLALRVAAAAAQLDWPSDRLEIQLLDDGRAAGHEALRQALRHIIPEHVNFHVLRRGEQKGFKAGNLAFGLAHSDAPYVAVLDADFVPPPDFLRRMVPALVADQGLAFVQARWGHANRTQNWLTRAQGLLLDSHFAVEQEGRFRAGLPISFNGTAGVWNRTAIEASGGWAGDTLAEDIDLSMRCTLKGWRAAMISDLEVPGELPDTAAAWRAQQARWTKGHAQVALKLLPEIWTSGLPIWKKFAMTLQVGQFAFYLLAGLSALLSLTLMGLQVAYLPPVAELGLAVTVLGVTGSVSYLYLGQVVLGRANEPALLQSLLLAVIFPSGLILSNARATYEAFAGTDLVFVTTPKSGSVYKGSWRGRPELTAGFLLPVFALAEQAWSAPFFCVAAAGLLSIGAMGWSGTVRVAVGDVVPVNNRN